jgi:small-conductance mechanosensitive channel
MIRTVGQAAMEAPTARRYALRVAGRGRLMRDALVSLVILAGVVATPGPPSWAAAPLSAELETAAEFSQAPVIMDGRELFIVRGISAYPAETRAKAIGDAIRAAAADPSVAADTLRLVEVGIGTQILAGDRRLVTVTDADAHGSSVPRPLLAEVFRKKIADVITAYRVERTPRALAVKIAVALGATVAAGALLWGSRRTFRWLGVSVERRFKRRIEGLEAQAYRLIRAQQVLGMIHGVLAALRFISIAAIGYVYLLLVLELFPWSRGLARQMETLFLAPLGRMGLAVLEAVPDLIFLAILILVVRYGLKLVRLFFAGVESGSIVLANFDRDWASPTYRIVRFLVIAFAVIVAYPYIPGSKSPAFQGVSIFIGVIFSLGSSSFIANMIAGYSMTYRRTFRVGDRIQIGNVTGDVAESGVMVTRLHTVKNEEIIVPNSDILSSHVVNYSTLAEKTGLILHTTVGIGYETPWRQVEAMLLLAAERTSGLLQEPRPFVLKKALGDFCVTYEINAYTHDPHATARLYSDLHRNILDVFNEYNVQIMTPAYEGDPEQPKVVPKEHWFASPARPPDATVPGGA